MSEDLEIIVLGFNDEVTTCARCGKEELRGTVILGTSDRVEIGRFGTTCASYEIDPSGKTKITRSSAKLIEEVRRDRVYWDMRRARTAIKNGEWQPACLIVTSLERDKVVRLDSEIAAIADVRAAARKIRAELRAAGKM